MAVFSCASCGHVLRVKDELVGKTGKCPQCKTVGRITAESPHQQSPSVVSASQASDYRQAAAKWYSQRITIIGAVVVVATAGFITWGLLAHGAGTPGSTSVDMPSATASEAAIEEQSRTASPQVALANEPAQQTKAKRVTNPKKSPSRQAAIQHSGSLEVALVLAKEYYVHGLLDLAKEHLVAIAFDTTYAAKARAEALYVLGTIAFDQGGTRDGIS